MKGPQKCGNKLRSNLGMPGSHFQARRMWAALCSPPSSVWKQWRLCGVKLECHAAHVLSPAPSHASNHGMEQRRHAAQRQQRLGRFLTQLNAKRQLGIELRSSTSGSRTEPESVVHPTLDVTSRGRGQLPGWAMHGPYGWAEGAYCGNNGQLSKRRSSFHRSWTLRCRCKSRICMTRRDAN